MSPPDWTHAEEIIARNAFNVGNQRSIDSLIEALKIRSQSLETVDSIWDFHDFLSTERHLYEGRAVFDFSNILFTLAEMLKQQLISLDQLEGLDPKKLSKIKSMTLF